MGIFRFEEVRIEKQMEISKCANKSYSEALKIREYAYKGLFFSLKNDLKYDSSLKFCPDATIR